MSEYHSMITKVSITLYIKFLLVPGCQYQELTVSVLAYGSSANSTRSYEQQTNTTTANIIGAEVKTLDQRWTKSVFCASVQQHPFSSPSAAVSYV